MSESLSWNSSSFSFKCQGFSQTDEKFSCHCQIRSDQLIENYRSILDRKQTKISTWKILEENGQSFFTRGDRCCQSNDALVIRSDRICLIHPWYKSIDLNDRILSSLSAKHLSAVFEVVLLEENSSSSKYQLAIIECPCVEQQGTFCTFCQCTLKATEPTESESNQKDHQERHQIVKENSHVERISRETQTKLFAILLPPSPLNEMRKATIEMKFEDKVTRACQINTLVYLIKTKVSNTPVSCSKARMNEYLSTHSSTRLHHSSIRNDRLHETNVEVPAIEFETLCQPPKCLNLYENVDFDRLHVNLTEKTLETNPSMSLSQSNNYYVRSSAVTHKERSNSSVSLPKELKMDRIKSETPSCSSSFIIKIDQHNQLNRCILSTSSNAHLLLATATKMSSAYQHLQTLLMDDKTSVDALIKYQISLAFEKAYQSVSILVDDMKSSEKHRQNFLHSIYKTLFDSLQPLIDDQSIKLTCLNLIYFNNSFYDRLTMQRLRLIDTGTKIYLQPLSIEIPLTSEHDITEMIRRLRTKMAHVHQLLIINFSHSSSMVSGSFLFLQLAPISTNRSSDRLTNLNGTTYSVMNLIRQLNKFHSSHDSKKKNRYLFNGCALNRLLKTYVSASQQTLTVFKIKPKSS